MDDTNVRYDDDTDVYTVEYAPADDESVTEAIVYAVASIVDADPASLPPLGEEVDTDAINTLFGQQRSAERNARLSFRYHGFEVTVYDHGEITFAER